jgi:transcriptional regulator with XRE-family HTH domain
MKRQRFGGGMARLARYIRENTTQAQFARDVECSEPHLSLVLKGKRGLSMRLARNISDKSGIPLEELAA